MKNYVVVKDGAILRTGQCPASMLSAQARDGETAIEHDGSVRDDTHYFVDGEFREYPPRPSAAHVFDFTSESWIELRTAADLTAEIATSRVVAISTVNTVAEAVRSRFVTPGSGQAMVYMEKQAEARAWFAAGEPEDLTEFPWLQAEIGITAPSSYELAQLWLNLSTIWAQIGSQLEAIRLTAIKDIEEQITEAGVQHVISQALAQMQSLVPN